MLKRIGVTAIALLLAGTSIPSAARQTMANDAPLIASQVKPGGLTSAQARKVLLLVLRHERLDGYGPGFHVDEIQFVPGYINFHVTDDSPQSAATTVIGAFVVSPRTGDVWEVNLCKRYDFPALRRVQATITSRTHQSFASEAAQRRALGCAGK